MSSIKCSHIFILYLYGRHDYTFSKNASVDMAKIKLSQPGVMGAESDLRRTLEGFTGASNNGDFREGNGVTGG